MIFRAIFNYFRTGDIASALVMLASLAMIFLVAMPVHEWAHAYTAHKQGDDTARLQGRMTINPMAHLTLIGCLMIAFIGFGYAKPVPVNINNLKNGRKSFALVSLAGPISNMLMGFIALLFLKFFETVIIPQSMVARVLYVFFYYFSTINISLAVFNLIPIPPLDGSRILTLVLPDKYFYVLAKYERYIMIAVFALIMFGALDKPLSWLTGTIYNALDKVASLPFMWLR
ncbi:MAG: site-2 protease family protein [Clostridia bacterium]|nr:site-2 protease family protein [Clostridia bacterium]